MVKCKVDISDAFKLIPIHPSLWPYHGIKWNNNYYYYTRLVFGSRSSPKIFDSLSVAICWIAMNILGIPVMFHLLDDFRTFDAPEVLAERTMSLISLLSIEHSSCYAQNSRSQYMLGIFRYCIGYKKYGSSFTRRQSFKDL